MKHSIRRQMALIYICLMAAIILSCCLLNRLFLDKYYINSKKQVIRSAYEKIASAASEDGYSRKEFIEELDAVCSNGNILVCVLDSEAELQYTSINGGERLEMLLYGFLLGIMDEDEVEILEEHEDYDLFKMGIEENAKLVMYGRLNSGISFVIETPLESIKESATVANQFFVYTGILGTILGAVIIWGVSGRISRPIKKLSEISEKMVHLDFDAKYEVKSKNEIGILGSNINQLSDSLQKSISELKTANNELQKDIEKREQIDEMRKEFLSNVSHELKTPLALIQGYAEGLAEGIDDDLETRNFYCDVIVDEASKMNHLVKELLTLNQLEFGNDVLTMERFDLTEMLQGCLQSMELILKQKEITIRMETLAPVYVWADSFKVEEVVRNYLSNAINHCSGERFIEITTSVENHKVKVNVFNTGECIPVDSIEHIWEKFYKVDKARTREYGGSGVGLSIVKAIMESLHQEYGVQNYTNGVLFWFTLETAQEEK